jgi:deoxyadenosine/deoxycytidine kinase
MKKPLVVNLTGAPGAGKSTGAATIFAELKKAGINAELVTEFAKDKTWEHNITALGCQEYVFGKQSYRLCRCRDDVDVIVTDSPLPLGLIYNNNPALDHHFTAVVLNVFNTYENINFFINRVKPYNPKGRNQTAEESDQISFRIKDLYKNLNIGYTEINGDTEGYTKAVQDVLEYLEFMKKEPIINE